MIVIEVILLILFVLFIITLFCMSFGNIQLRVDGCVIKAHVELQIAVRFCGIRLLTLRWPDSDIAHGSSRVHWIMNFIWQHQVVEGIDRVMHYEGLQKELEKLRIKSLSVSHVYWSTTFGLGEAHQTAVFVGLLWALKSSLISIINNVLQGRMTRPVLQVCPDYSEELGFRTHFKCMIRFRLGHAISKAVKVAKYKKRRQKTCQKNTQYKV